ncbi:DUF779 domain-containing protein [Cohaesibacter celericrescens]|uniref:DUF779 domain-containing protein n=1 Tax=Cohaesibacter celericrescens TaxID=2067669 RepID=UPI003563F985
MKDKPVPSVTATEPAIALLRQLKAQYGEKLIFHQSGGCCDGSAPMCYEASDFMLGDNDVKLGELDGVPFYIGRDQGERWGATNLIIDAIAGNGGMFSLDNGTGRRFLTRSEVCAAPTSD